MTDIKFSTLADAGSALPDLIGFHYRVLQTKPIQESLATVQDGQVIDELRKQFGQIPLLDMTTKTFEACEKQGGVFVAHCENVLLGYIAYSPMTGKQLALRDRPSEPIAFINFFRVINPDDRDTAKALIDMALGDAREQGHFRIGFSMAKDNAGELVLEKMLPKTALGTEDKGRLRIMGMNAADMALGVYRRPAHMKGPSVLILKP